MSSNAFCLSIRLLEAAGFGGTLVSAPALPSTIRLGMVGAQKGLTGGDANVETDESELWGCDEGRREDIIGESVQVD
jgi:hypothetical protein